MVFKEEEEAYEFYNRYGGHVGFSVRKANSLRCPKTPEVRFRKFCCCREGKHVEDKHRTNVKQHRAETRCGYMSNMKISRCKNGCYYVIAFNETHNHIIATPKKKHMLRSQRKMTEPQTTQVRNADDSRINPKASIELMVTEAGGRENIEFQFYRFKELLMMKSDLA
ncbi:PREDICTED: protein FAR1-RELATED SEQUENCE 5-like [Nelumbo nucifera]|uniref:Protein FAR1-RELATED SEQUENCE 5-like n=1 Tax=Nelumbo nucifera TaxID=4432 RepID=A0A1U8AEG0_NELNU|nr:PREDICTED: protein FAR1-RELATED SEQUENCE 5-like [Nelumbo nucifera]